MKENNILEHLLLGLSRRLRLMPICVARMPLWPLRVCVCVSFPTSVLPLQLAHLWTLITRRRLLNFSPMLLEVTFLRSLLLRVSQITANAYLCCCSLVYVSPRWLLGLSRRLRLSLSPAAQGVEPAF
jgi:hypothetical protein